MKTGEWYVILSGEHEGRAHMAGWMLTAIKGADTGSRDYGQTGDWVGLGICPRCYATVITGREPSYGDQTWAHEAWHAATDYPIPAEVAARVTR